MSISRASKYALLMTKNSPQSRNQEGCNLLLTGTELFLSIKLDDDLSGRERCAHKLSK